MVLRELAYALVRLLSVNIQKVVEICNDCRKANVDPFSKKAKRSAWSTSSMSTSLRSMGRSLECVLLEHTSGHEKEEENPVNYKPVNITSVSGKVGQPVLVEAIFKCKNMV